MRATIATWSILLKCLRSAYSQVMIIFVTRTKVSRATAGVGRLSGDITAAIRASKISNRNQRMSSRTRRCKIGEDKMKSSCLELFKIKARSFQVNTVQNEVLYQQAIDARTWSGYETVVDAYRNYESSGRCEESLCHEIVDDADCDGEGKWSWTAWRMHFETGAVEKIMPRWRKKASSQINDRAKGSTEAYRCSVRNRPYRICQL